MSQQKKRVESVLSAMDARRTEQAQAKYRSDRQAEMRGPCNKLLAIHARQWALQMSDFNQEQQMADAALTGEHVKALSDFRSETLERDLEVSGLTSRGERDEYSYAFRKMFPAAKREPIISGDHYVTEFLRKVVSTDEDQTVDDVLRLLWIALENGDETTWRPELGRISA